MHLSFTANGKVGFIMSFTNEKSNSAGYSLHQQENQVWEVVIFQGHSPRTHMQSSECSGS